MSNNRLTAYQVLKEGKTRDASTKAEAIAMAKLLTEENKGTAHILRCVVAYTVIDGVVQEAVDAE